MRTLELKQVSVEDLQDGEYYLVYEGRGNYEVVFYSREEDTMYNGDEYYYKCSSNIYYHLPY